MKHVLLPVDAANSERTRSAVQEVVRLYRDAPVVVHLLRVQPRVSGHVASYFDPSDLHHLLEEWGSDDLQPARQLLDAAGIPYEAVVRVGRSAPTIVATARELGCDRVVFGSDSPGIGEKLFGSLAQQVRQLLHSTGDPQVIGT